MRLVFLCLLAIALCGAASAQLDKKQVRFKAGDHMVLHPVLSLPCDAPAPRLPLRAVHQGTGKEFPATVRDGELVFIPEGSMPNQEHVYTLRVLDLGEGYTPRVKVVAREGEPVVDVLIDDALFTAYHHPAEGKKPFLWPVNSAGGYPITRDFPMNPDGLPKDHPHHKSFWSAYGEVNGVDCWAEGKDSGFQASGEVTHGSGDAYGWISAKNVWQDKDRKPVIAEEREYRFYATPEDARIFDVRVTFSADYGDVDFTDTKEGGIVSVRMRPEMSGAAAVITNALGDVGEENLWGKPAAWCDYSAETKEAGWRGLTIFDNPANLRHPTGWHVRKYGLMGANCFGYKYFLEKDYNKPLITQPNGDLKLKQGEKLTFNYRVYVHSGDVNQAQVANRYAEYAAPFAVTWVEPAGSFDVTSTAPTTQE